MKHPKMIIILSLALYMSGCAFYHVDYDISLYEVKRSSIINENQDKQRVIKFEEHGKVEYNFKDEIIQTIWRPTSSQFLFSLTNKTDHPITLIWDGVRYIDENGARIRVIHSGVQYIDRYNSQRSTKIDEGSTISDFIFPADNVYYVGEKYGGWRELPLFTNLSVISAQELAEKAEKNIGKSVQVVLPIETQNIINEYIFSFKIHDFQIK
jgi:hypothetical protein